MRIKKYTETIKVPAKASACYLAASVATKAIGVICTPFFTRLMTGEEYGRYAEYISIVGIISTICSVITSSSAVYKVLGEKGKNQSTFLKAILTINLSFSLVFCILLFAFHHIWGINREILLPISLQIFSDGIIAIYLTRSKFNYKYLRVSLITLLGSALPSVISLLILYRWGGGFEIRAYSMLFISIGFAVFGLINLRQGEKTNLKEIKSALTNVIPLMPHGISNAVSSQADKLILSSVLGALALAKYSVVFSLGNALQFTVSAVGAALSPWIIRKLQSGEQEKIKQLLSPMIIGYFALSVSLIAISPEAMRILAPDSYLEAFTAIAPIALAMPFSFISMVCTVALVYSEKGGKTALISCISSAICIVLCYALIGNIGFLGAGLSVFASQVLNAAFSLCALYKINFSKLLGIGKIAPICLAGIGTGLLFYFLKHNIILRGVLLIIPASALIYCLIKAKDMIFEKDAKTAP